MKEGLTNTSKTSKDNVTLPNGKRVFFKKGINKVSFHAALYQGFLF